MGRHSKHKSRRVQGKAQTQAARADRHDLYERSVQGCDADVAFFSETFEEIRGRAAKSFREDFCGTAKLSAAWCRSAEDRTAVGIDLDGPTLEIGATRNLTMDVADRVTLYQQDVLAEVPGQADITCAMNFSYFVFKERATLREYLESARDALNDDGLLFLEIYGGQEAMEELEEERELEGFTYVWEQESFDPLTHETLCHIHFRFPDGSEISKAFTYSWRWWSVPELRDLCKEAGFSDVRVFWETMEEDPDDPDSLEGTGEYEDVTDTTQENQESWLAYVVAVK
ncbi:MAG: class I SAM-dependent methyltransferase [Nannocystaceae bacterium]